MKDGLFDIGVVSFVFAPLALTVTVLMRVWRNRINDIRATMPMLDAPGLLLTAAVRHMPEEGREWGAAMMAELSQVQGLASRWRFALGCARVALFPPRGVGRLRHSQLSPSPFCGALAVALPPLGLPFIYFAAVIVEAIGGSPFTQSSQWSNPDAVIGVVKIIVTVTILCLLAGLPLGLAGLLRRERPRWLSALGILSSLCVIGYFMLVMHFVAGGPNGD
ncbi:MAG TPA: hypothetical protein VJ810_34060 [Blastocatellia bacterium]|nr:hypothetical protein [Blastocatellia bacterium]